MKIALAQINATIADFQGNAARIIEKAREADAQGAELVLFPELALCGYPPLDLLDRRDFVADAEAALARLAEELPRLPCLVGNIERREGRQGKSLWNTAFLIAGKRIIARQRKTLLPTYDVFDEARYFEPSPESRPVLLAGHSLGITICEDLWNDPEHVSGRLYDRDPARELAEQGADLLLNIAASPFHMGKHDYRQGLLSAVARKHGTWLAYANLVGGNDTLIFEGGSFVANPQGEVVAATRPFEETLLVVDIDNGLVPVNASRQGRIIEDLHDALALGVRDYFAKCGFRRAVLGLSGGIDSAVTAAIGVAALGRENVMGVLMPGPYSSAGSVKDAEDLAANLGIETRTVAIGPIYERYAEAMASLHPEASFGVTEENLQSRIRGDIVMAIANREGRLALTTGNKSELAVGYCTLYGDMCGGIAVIGDVPKLIVYDLARHMNMEGEVIPASTIEKPPSAELAPDQKDEDSLPPYEVLDRLVTATVEDGLSPEELIAEGHDRATVERVTRLIHINEYKRQQAAPVLKVTPKAFGIGRRYPIARKL